MSNIQSNYENINRMILFNFFNTGNPVYDSIISTVMISFVGYIVNYIYENSIDKYLFNFNFDDIKNLFLTKYTIVI